MLSLEFAVKVDIVWQLQEPHFCRTGMIFYTTKLRLARVPCILALQDMHCLQGEKGAVIRDVHVEGYDSKNHYLCGVPQPLSSVPLLNFCLAHIFCYSILLASLNLLYLGFHTGNNL